MRADVAKGHDRIPQDREVGAHVGPPLDTVLTAVNLRADGVCPHAGV